MKVRVRVRVVVVVVVRTRDFLGETGWCSPVARTAAAGWNAAVAADSP